MTARRSWDHLGSTGENFFLEFLGEHSAHFWFSSGFLQLSFRPKLDSAGMENKTPKDKDTLGAGTDRGTEGGATDLSIDPMPLRGQTGEPIPSPPVALAKNGSPAPTQRGRSEGLDPGPIGTRKTPVVRVSLRSLSQRSSLLAAMGHLTDRDIQIFFDLYRYKVLTTDQIVELHFNSTRVASRRILMLFELGFLERFQPHRATGSFPYHYVLAEPGAFVVASRMDRDFKDFKWTRIDVERLAVSQTLRHTVEANGFFTRLAWAYRRSGKGFLKEWRSGYTPQFSWAVIADGIGTIIEGERGVRFFYEHDRGTESHLLLQDKMEEYNRIPEVFRSEADRKTIPSLILFTFPSEEREMRARHALTGSGFALATATYPSLMLDPLGTVWLALGKQERVRLIDLRSDPPPAEAEDL